MEFFALVIFIMEFFAFVLRTLYLYSKAYWPLYQQTIRRRGCLRRWKYFFELRLPEVWFINRINATFFAQIFVIYYLLTTVSLLDPYVKNERNGL